MKKRITIVFDENDELYKRFLDYVNKRYLTLTTAIKQAISELIRRDSGIHNDL